MDGYNNYNGKKPKVLFAIGFEKVENYFEKNLSDRCDVIKDRATHRGSVLELINKNCPDVVILDVRLSTSSEDISFDELILRIRTEYSFCRIIIMSDKREPGDGLLSMLISRGVYDIDCGENNRTQDVIDMVFHPRNYGYASRLQALDAVSDKEAGIDPFASNNQISLNTEQSVNISANMNYGGIINTEENKEESIGDTSILTADMQAQAVQQQIYPMGIIFYPIEQNNPVVLSGKRDVAPYYNKDGYRSDNVLYGNAQRPPVVRKNGKIISFISARQGVGCTSNAINTAYAFASEEKQVLLIDGNFGRSSIYQKLGLPEDYGYTMEDVLKAYSNNKDISRLPLSRTQIKTGDKIVPKTLSFLRFSDNFNYYEATEGLSDVLDAFKKQYDYIIIDTSIVYSNVPIVIDFLGKSSKIFLVVLQDTYEVNVAYQTLQAFNGVLQIKNKITPLINRYIKGGFPSAKQISNVFISNVCVTMPEDTAGYMTANSVAGVYFDYTKKKIKEKYLRLQNEV